MGTIGFEIEHVGLAARNTIMLKEWYVRVLGAKVLFDNSMLPPAFVLELGQGTWLEIYPGAKAAATTDDNLSPGWRHLALRVKSIEEARTSLVEKGVRFTESYKPAGGGGRVLFFRDPEGNGLHLVERPADSPLYRD